MLFGMFVCVYLLINWLVIVVLLFKLFMFFKLGICGGKLM